MESTLQRISRVTGRKFIECKCAKCKLQCKTPCLGTPEDIMKLINAGYKEQLSRTYWCPGMLRGKIDHPVVMVQAIQTPSGCIFFENGLCKLHASGLKPTEGKLSHHSVKAENFEFRKSLSWNVAKEWESTKNEALVKEILNLYLL